MSRYGFVTLDRAADVGRVSHGVLRSWLRQDGLELHRTPEGPVVLWRDLHRCLAEHGREEEL